MAVMPQITVQLCQWVGMLELSGQHAVSSRFTCKGRLLQAAEG